ncbi:MAG: PIG-L family deacetylase [Planctomycetaceae bacterium]|nr:PIG-L family deacetylase [Planctomycetaceae bacterium]
MPTVLAVMAHPDDIELTCAGTLILLKRAGWKVHLATMTAGDLGSMKHSRAEIAAIRRQEAAASARLIGAGYTCLGFDDLTVSYSEASKRAVSGLLRAVEPDLLVLHSPDCYMADHTESARIAREAAFASTIPNWTATFDGKPTTAAKKLPSILYADPIENIDALGRRVPARFVVDITSVLDMKEKMLAAHDSQRSWLREQHGEDEYLLWMRRNGADRARDLQDPAVQAAEGFTPHWGHGFPREDWLTRALGPDFVRKMEISGC